MNTIEMTPVESKMLHSVGYDAHAKELHARFAAGGPIYIYHDVPPEAHAALMAAESKGKHFLARIKGAYKHTKVETPKP
jgi:KTSC domain